MNSVAMYLVRMGALLVIAGRLLLAPAAARTHRLIPRAPRIVTFRKANVCLEYDLDRGVASLAGSAGLKLRGFYSSVRIGRRYYTSKDYTKRICSRKGDEIVVTLTGRGLPEMRQRFALSAVGHALVSVEVTGKRLSSNWMAPIVANSAGCVDIAGGRDVRALQVPFDNDRWARYAALPFGKAGKSHEVAAFYDNAARKGLVIGSVTHDTWKTGITFSGEGHRLSRLMAFGGIADEGTRDVMPHGSVSGKTIRSPKVMVGFYADWRNGMEHYARANALQVPMLPWAGGVPFGWNSWGSVQTKLSYAKAVAVSDFIARNLQNHGFSNHGTAYINLDSYWDNLSDVELRRFTAHVHANGQRAGIYWAPFVYWGNDLLRNVEGSGYTYGDIALRTDTGATISMSGATALDPTHPGTLRRIDHYVDRFKSMGFDYLKLDFLTHGAMEGGSRNGAHFDPTVQTGIQAYNHGMSHLLKRAGGTMFISESIGPLFPYQYAHARRVSCDSYGSIAETEYVMNCVSYGWWASGRLYAFNDPDHMVLETHRPRENQSRVTSGAVAGTVFLNGDDLTEPVGQALARAHLTNDAINAVARLGKAFRPVEGNSGTPAVDVLTMRAGSAHYLAVFNYDSKAASTIRIDLARAGMSAGSEYAVTDLWCGRKWTAKRIVSVDLEAEQSTILRLEQLERSQ